MTAPSLPLLFHFLATLAGSPTVRQDRPVHCLIVVLGVPLVPVLIAMAQASDALVAATEVAIVARPDTAMTDAARQPAVVAACAGSRPVLRVTATPAEMRAARRRLGALRTGMFYLLSSAYLMTCRILGARQCPV